MILLWVAAVAQHPQPKPNPYARYLAQTLVISDGNAMTRMEYRDQASCERARDAVRRQTAPPPNTQYEIHGPSRVTAFCVPR